MASLSFQLSISFYLASLVVNLWHQKLRDNKERMSWRAVCGPGSSTNKKNLKLQSICAQHHFILRIDIWWLVENLEICVLCSTTFYCHNCDVVSNHNDQVSIWGLLKWLLVWSGMLQTKNDEPSIRVLGF